MKTKYIPPYLWFYIYDEDILPARIYSPSHKSLENCQEGCSSLQLEIYHENNKPLNLLEEDILKDCIEKLVKMKVIKEEDIIIKDIRHEKYANILFDFNIYNSRRKIREYFEKRKIKTIGRFGEWDYFWSDQSLMSGKILRKDNYEKSK